MQYRGGSKVSVSCYSERKKELEKEEEEEEKEKEKEKEKEGTEGKEGGVT